MKPTKTCHYGNNIVYIYDSASVLKRAATEHIVRYAVGKSAKKPVFSMALSGGSTPIDIYKGLVSEKWMTTFPWPQSYFIFGDERYVPHDHEQSNYRMAMEAFLHTAPVEKDHIYPVPTHCEHPEDCAGMYERQLKELPGSGGTDEIADGIPGIDLILLGMGDDGHTASLFPGTEILKESESAVAAVYVDKLDSWRISMTFPIINKAKQVMVLVAGDAKSQVFADIMLADVRSANGMSTGEEKYPIQMINNPNGMLWFVDQRAASRLG